MSLYMFSDIRFESHYYSNSLIATCLHAFTADLKYLCLCNRASGDYPPPEQLMDDDYLKTTSDCCSYSLSNLKCLDNLNYLIVQILT